MIRYNQEGTPMFYSGIDQHKRDCFITTRRGRDDSKERLL